MTDEEPQPDITKPIEPPSPAEPAQAAEPEPPAEPVSADVTPVEPVPPIAIASVADATTDASSPDEAALPPEPAVPAAEAPPAPAEAPPAGPPIDPTADRPVASAEGQPGRRRWAIAAVAIALVVVGIVAVALLAGRGSVEAIAPRYLPATTVQYMDIRLDLPGDQQQEAEAFLAAFPGFDDSSTLETKADDTFDRLVREATEGQATYTGDIKLWFGGQVAVATTGLPNVGSIVMGEGSVPALPVLGLISVKDAAAAEETIDRLTETAGGVGVSKADVDGHPTWTFSDGASVAAQSPATVTLTDDILVVGQDPDLVAESVKLGTQGGANLAGSSTFTEATGELPEARLATLFIDGAVVKLALQASGVPGLDAALDAFPTSIAGAMTVSEGDLRLVARANDTTMPEGMTMAASVLTDDVPAGSFVYLEGHEVGSGIGRALGLVKDQPGLEQVLPSIEMLEGVLGARLDELFSWVGDAALVGWQQNSAPAAAIVAEVSDAATAEQRIAQLQTIIQLAGISGQLDVATSSVAGATVTTITVIDAGQKVTVSFTLADGLFVVGLGSGAVEGILEVTPETSLASDSTYQSTMTAAGPNEYLGSIYLDLAGVRAAAEPQIQEGERARYDQDVKPWLVPFETIGGVSFMEGTTSVSQMVITTQQP